MLTKKSPYAHLVFFALEWQARKYCQIKNLSGRIFAVCRSPVSGKYAVADLGTAIRLGDWYEIVV
jgi:hypothetical protein